MKVSREYSLISLSKKSSNGWAFSCTYGKIDMGDARCWNEENWIADTEMLVPKDHLLRKIDAAVDFNWLYEMVEPFYREDNGRPS